MATSDRRPIVVTGATGLQGGAVTRHLLRDSWHVRAFTRDASSKQAQVLAELGAEVVQGDMGDAASLQPVFEGAYGIYSVQNPFIGGPLHEIRQGKNVADVAKDVGVEYLVYGSAGTGEKGTGVPSWETKLQIEDHIKALDLPLTILRPTAFMEVMTHRKFFPAIGAWQVMPTLMGSSRRLPWLCTEDLGAIAARAFADPHSFVGMDLTLVSDVQSLDECRSIYREVMGRNPRRLPMPVWLFERFGFVGKDLTTMWRWLRTGDVDLETAPTRKIHPDALTVRGWLSRQKTAESASR
jgi:uncharacterized protein YbjT (DUF2867 family)